MPAETVAGVVIAYEPLWAIGTGQAATPEDAQEACQWIREVVGRCADLEAAGQIRIQYGGSVNADNTEALLRCPDVDGALVGGASLDAATFVGDHPGRGTDRSVSLVASPPVTGQGRKSRC